MKNNAGRVSAFALAIALISMLQHAALCQQTPSDARGQADQIYLRWDVSQEFESNLGAFGMIVAVSGRPGGGVFVEGCTDAPRRPLRVPGHSSLASALDLLTGVFPTHYWTVQDGVVNLLPKQREVALMQTPVEHFEWNTASLPTYSVTNLEGSEAVQSRIKELRLTPGPVGFSLLQQAPHVTNGVPDPPKGREFKVDHVTLLTALNRIAASYGNAYWWYLEKTCGNKREYRLWIH